VHPKGSYQHAEQKMKSMPILALVLRHENAIYRKNKLYYEKGLFMPFSKHTLLLYVGFVKHDWQLACLRWFVYVFRKFEHKPPLACQLPPPLA
jgi:hypothetical protein